MWVTREVLHSLDLSSASDGDACRACSSAAVYDESGNSSEESQIDARRGSRVMSRSDDAECALDRTMSLEWDGRWKVRL